GIRLQFDAPVISGLNIILAIFIRSSILINPMEITAIIAYILALLVGISLGLMGSGGSILTVPILVYVLGIDAVTATGYSLFIVGFTALAGGLRSIRSKNVAFDMVAVFGLPSMVAAYITRAFIIPALPDPVINNG